MANDNETNFTTAWDIDQVLLPNPIPLSLSIAASPDGGTTAATATMSYAHNLGYLPNIEAQYQGAGQSTWHQCGLPDGFLLANWDISSSPPALLPFWPGLLATNGASVSYGFDTSNVYFNALNYNTIPQILPIRLYLWADKVDY